jgi:RNA polymerase sigma-70 factor (ECF subfamily)
MTTTETDMSLLRRYTERGDHAAFAEITRRYAGVVFAACHRVLGDSNRAEDVAQETFFRLMRKPHAVSQSLGAWLHTAATNLAVDAVRSEAARRRREHEYAHEIIQEREEAALEVSSWAELSPQLDAALAELPEDDRTLLVAHFLQGRAQNELAADAKTSAATMCRRIRNAVEALQQKLKKRGMFTSPLCLAGLMRDNAMQNAPASLGGQLGKMTMFCNARSFARATRPPVLWTAAAIITVSVSLGALFAVFGGRGGGHRLPPTQNPLVVRSMPMDR